MGQKYTVEALHPIRHMGEYVDEIMAGQVSPFRTQQLKARFKEVKEVAKEMYKDAYTLIMEIDNESMQDPEYLWKHDLDSVRIFSTGNNHSFGDYSNEKLHPIRHFEEYKAQIEVGGIHSERVVELKEKLGIVLRLAVTLYFDAERLIRLLE